MSRTVKQIVDEILAESDHGHRILGEADPGPGDHLWTGTKSNMSFEEQQGLLQAASDLVDAIENSGIKLEKYGKRVVSHEGWMPVKAATERLKRYLRR